MAVTPQGPAFRESFSEVFEDHFPRLFGFLDRLSGDPELAADISQEAFARLYRLGSMPDSAGAWLVTVGLNLYRNDRAKRSRRWSLLSPAVVQGALSDQPPAPDAVTEREEEARRVRGSLDRLDERDRQLLLLRAEGFSYREIALSLGVKDASIGTLLARAKKAFRSAYEEAGDAPG